jgi:hypothetical protein
VKWRALVNRGPAGKERTSFITSPPPKRDVIRRLSDDRGRRVDRHGRPTRTPVPGEPGEFITHVDLKVVGGSGKYAEATGTMTFDGGSHTRTVPRTADLIYKGTVCGPNVKGND